MFSVFHETADCSQLEIVAFYYPSTPDRTAAIQGTAISPIPFLLESYRVLHIFGVDCVGIACNTMHYWLDRQKRVKKNPKYFDIHTYHMIDETARWLAHHGVSLAGLLATTGTVETKLYQSACERQGIQVILPDIRVYDKGNPYIQRARMSRCIYSRFGVGNEGSNRLDNTDRIIEFLVDSFGEQEGLVMEAVYGEFGVKQGYTSGIAPILFLAAVDRLVQRGVEHIILGCTELPLLVPAYPVFVRGTEVHFIDPNEILAKTMMVTGRRGKTLGIIGGMGPAATIDLLAKLDVHPTAVKYMQEIYSETIRQLNAAGVASVKDQDHLEYVFINTSRPEQHIVALKKLGIDFICYTNRRNKVEYSLNTFEVESDVSAIVKRAMQRGRVDMCN
jgi:aspartate/glutamate racemase